MTQGEKLLSRASPEILEEMLSGVMEPRRLLAAALKHALYMVYAEKGLVFTAEGLIMAVGYDGRAQQRLVRHLDPLLMEGGMHWYSAPCFNLGLSSALERGPKAMCWEGTPQPDHKVVSMAGVIPGQVGLLAVLAVERETAIGLADRRAFSEWLSFVAIPAGAAAENARTQRLRDTRELKLSDLPLERLTELPTLAELERLVIAEAMRRNSSVKTKAAEQLGLTREGLRKKIMRLAET
jgi:DNA-binding protein Fis